MMASYMFKNLLPAPCKGPPSVEKIAPVLAKHFVNDNKNIGLAVRVNEYKSFIFPIIR